MQGSVIILHTRFPTKLQVHNLRITTSSLWPPTYWLLAPSSKARSPVRSVRTLLVAMPFVPSSVLALNVVLHDTVLLPPQRGIPAVPRAVEQSRMGFSQRARRASGVGVAT